MVGWLMNALSGHVFCRGSSIATHFILFSQGCLFLPPGSLPTFLPSIYLPLILLAHPTILLGCSKVALFSGEVAPEV